MTESRKKAVSCPWRIRALERKDLGAVLAIERVSFPSPWTETAFLQELSNPMSRFWVLEGGDVNSPRSVMGYLCVWVVLNEMHIMNLATHPGYRRRGVALKLLHHAFDQARDMEIDTIVLEVRPSNLVAQSLYRSLGFYLAGRRSGYYRDTGEDAIVMVRRVREEDEDPSGTDPIRP
jgi:ribosomal-protein-alanine N-acetyltransferase